MASQFKDISLSSEMKETEIEQPDCPAYSSRDLDVNETIPDSRGEYVGVSPWADGVSPGRRRWPISDMASWRQPISDMA